MSDQQNKLRRVLGFWPAYGAAVGLVVSGTAMVSVGNVAGISGKAAFITALIALIPMMAAAFAYGELSAMIPGGGMVSDYTMPALGRFWAIFAILSGYIMLIAADGGTQQVVAGLSIERLTGIPQYIGSTVLLLTVLVINLIGVNLYGRTEAVLTVSLMLVFLLVGLFGLAGVGEAYGVAEPVADQSIMPDKTVALFSGVGVAIWWFIGFEFACPLAEENVKPHRNIPYALIIGLLTIYAVDVIFVWAASTYTPAEVLSSSSIPHVDAAQHMLGDAGFLVMTIITIVAAFTTANAEMAALPRMLYGMARERLAPQFFGRIHPRTRTPWNGIFFTAVLMAATLVYITAKGANIDVILSLILTAVVTWMISYAIAMVDVLVLRKKYPDYPRLWKAPLAPITMPLGLAGVAFAIWTIISYVMPAVIFMIGMAVVTVLWLKKQKLPVFGTIPIEKLAQEIRDRSESEPEWDGAIGKWLENRPAWDNA